MQNIIKTVILSMSLSTTLALGAAEMSSPHNLLKNSGFEKFNENSPTFWRARNVSGEGENAVSADLVDKHSGKSAMKIHHEKGDSYSVFSQVVTVKPNTDYTLSVYAKVKDIKINGGGGPRIFIQTPKAQYAASSIKSKEWKLYHKTFNSKHLTTVTVMGYLHKAGGTLWVDDLVLVEGTEVGKYNSNAMADKIKGMKNIVHGEVIRPLDLSEDEKNQINMPNRRTKKNSWIGKVKIVNEGVDGNPCLLLNGPYAIQQVKYNTEHISRRSTSEGILDRFYKLSAMVKGHGVLKYGIKSIASSGLQTKIANQFNWGGTVTLTDQWQKITMLDSEKNPYCKTHQVYFKLSDNSQAYISDVNFTYIHTETPKLEITPAPLVGAPGDIISIDVKIANNKTIMARIYKTTLGSRLRSETVVKDGKLKIKIPEDAKQNFKVIISAPEVGVAKELYIMVMPKKELQELEKLAEQVKLQQPKNILLIGDSLSDFFRGHNFINIVNELLKKYNPGKVSIKNAGVGGDFITRVWKRMRGSIGKGAAYRQYMYDNLLDPKPDLIFIFLGANDTKCSSSSNFKTPVVIPKNQKILFERLVNYLKTATGAKIVFIEPPCFNAKLCAENSAKLLKKGRLHSRFGIKKALLDFNQVNRQLATKYKLGYIEQFDISESTPDKEQLFIASDGVHLTEKGNRFVALQIMKYLAKNNILTQE